MNSPRSAVPSLAAIIFATIAIAFGSSVARAAGHGGGGGGGGHGGGGHGGGVGGHPGGIVHGGYRGYGPGFRGGYGYGYGYPFYGYGYGFGLGIGLGYGMGYGYGYPGYSYAGYGYGYPGNTYGYPSLNYGPNNYPGYNYPGYNYPGYGYPPNGQAPNGYPPPGSTAPPNSAPTGPGGTVGTPPVRFNEGDAVLSVRTPADAIVWINGQQTNQSGPRREFVSSGLAPGRTYTFHIHAHWAGPDGKPTDAYQRILILAGERRAIDFGMPPLNHVAPVNAMGR